MTPDLEYLALSALLTAVLWIPYIAGQIQANGFPTAGYYKDPTPGDLPLWVRRADRAHINSVESLAPFAVLVLVAHASGGANAMTAVWAMVFFWARVAHAVIYILGIPYLRTIIFTIGFVAVLGLFWEVVG